MNSGVDIVIPVYNEGANIATALQRIKSEVHCPYRVLIVYDKDTDNTLPAVEKVLADGSFPRESLFLVKNLFDRGALNAIKTGLTVADSRYVVVTMADLSDPPSVINKMLKMAELSHADLVCGSRYMPGGIQKGGPLLKRTLSRLAGVSLRYLIGFPTHDVTNSFKLYSKEMLKNITIESTGGFELGMEIVVKAWSQGYKVMQVPTSWEDRSAGESRFQLFKWLPCYLRWYRFAFVAKVFPQKPKNSAFKQV